MRIQLGQMAIVNCRERCCDYYIYADCLYMSFGRSLSGYCLYMHLRLTWVFIFTLSMLDDNGRHPFYFLFFKYATKGC